MAVIPAWPVLPADMLRPIDILNKFRARSLAGLGLAYDDYGNPIDPGIITGSGEVAIEGSGLPGGLTVSESPTSSTTLTPFGYDTLPAGGSLTIPSTVSATAGGRVNTSSTDPYTMAFISQLLKQGMSLAQIATLQPGTVIQQGPGGTSTILRQSAPGTAPVPVTGVFGSISAGASANQGATLAILAVAGVVLFMMMGRR